MQQQKILVKVFLLHFFYNWSISLFAVKNKGPDLLNYTVSGLVFLVLVLVTFHCLLTHCYLLYKVQACDKWREHSFQQNGFLFALVP